MVTPRGIEPLLPPWKGGVLTAWPRGQDKNCLYQIKFQQNNGSRGEIRTHSLPVNSRVLHRWATLEHLNWQRPTLPGSYLPSTISAEGLNFCVRNGNRCIPFAIVTRCFNYPNLRFGVSGVLKNLAFLSFLIIMSLCDSINPCISKLPFNASCFLSDKIYNNTCFTSCQGFFIIFKVYSLKTKQWRC